MKAIFLSLVLMVSLSAFAQEPEKVTVKMIDGTTYIGTIKEKSDDFVVLITVHGELKLSTKSIKKIEAENYVGEYPFASPHYTRYFFAPAGRPLEKGDGYYQNLMLFGNFFNYGITDNFSMGAGFEFVSLFAGGTPIIFLTPKAGFKIANKTYAGAGSFIIGVPNDFGGNGGMNFAGIVFGSITRGSKDAHATIGVGYGVADGNWARYPVINFSGFARASKSIGFMTENYFIPAFDIDNDGIIIAVLGPRIMGKKSAFDIGLMMAIGEGVSPLPYVGYSVAF